MLTRRMDVLYTLLTGLWAAAMAWGLILGPPSLWSSSSFDAMRRLPGGLASWGAPYLLVALLAALVLAGHRWRRRATGALFLGMAALAFGMAIGLVLTFVAAWLYGDLIGLTGVVNGSLIAAVHLLFAIYGGRHEQPVRRRAGELDGVPRADRDGGLGHPRGAGQGVVGCPPPRRPGVRAGGAGRPAAATGGARHAAPTAG